MLESIDTVASIARGDKPFSVCFVALSAYGLFDVTKSVSHIGGAEAQQLEIASYLRDQGYCVSFIVKDHGQDAEILVDGFQIIRAYDPNAGLPVVRFLHPRWTQLNQAMKAADADMYYQRGSGVETAQVAWWCQRNNKRFMFAAASEGDCTPALPMLHSGRDRWMYRKGLLAADRVAAQTKRQATLLNEHFQVDAFVSVNVMRAAACETDTKPKSGNRILWVGRLDAVKRVEWVLELAEKNAQLEFLLIGSANQGSDYTASIMARIAALRNVEHQPNMSKAALRQEYRSARALLSTSLVEGFPNVYIEGWLEKLPVVCSYDPDDVVQNHGLGWSCQSIEQFQVALTELMALTPDAYEQLGARVLDYAERTHSPAAVLPNLEREIADLVGS